MPGSEDAALYYSIQPIPGKGLGLVAAKNIPKGVRILAESHLFIVSPSDGGLDTIGAAIAQKLKRLSKEDQRAFFSLANSHHGLLNPLYGIVRTNALPLGPGAGEGGIFPRASRINHACLPNCQHTWNENIGKETIHAVRHIEKGEEITIAYSDTEPSSERRARLQSQFMFSCSCSLCSLPPADLKKSDARLEAIRLLDTRIGDPFHLAAHPQDHLKLVEALVKALEEERITDARLPRAYYDAFQTTITHGDTARATVFAERAYNARVCCEGEDSQSSIRMERLMLNPTSHPAFASAGTRRKTRTRTRGRGIVPKDLSYDELENWLWGW